MGDEIGLLVVVKAVSVDARCDCFLGDVINEPRERMPLQARSLERQQKDQYFQHFKETVKKHGFFEIKYLAEYTSIFVAK